MKKILKYKGIAIVFLLLSAILMSCSSPDFNTYVENSKVYDFSIDIEQLEGEIIDIADYNLIFIDDNDNEFHYALNGEQLDDNVAGEIPEVSEINTINEDGSEGYETFENQLSILGKLSISEDYETFLFKFEDYEYEYINLNNYSKDGQLLSAICLFFKEKDGRNYTYSELKPNKEIWQYTATQESVEEETILKVFVLDNDGYFRVIRENEATISTQNKNTRQKSFEQHSIENVEIPAKLTDRQEQIITNIGYTVSYNSDWKIPNWVAYELTKEEAEGVEPRGNKFIPDPAISYKNSATTDDYKNTGWDRGHMAPAGDMKWSEQVMKESFYLSNICPQNRNLNGGIWKSLEEQVRDLALQKGSIYVVCGPIVSKQPQTIGNNKVAVPDAF
jgi:DNA/RNA endonuclease G (NUC1)